MDSSDCEEHVDWYSWNCEKSCNTCGRQICNTDGDRTFEFDAACELWKSQGYCEHDPWMWANCKKSCNLCEEWSCQNKYSDEICESYVQEGMCTHEQWGPLIRLHCEVSCNACCQHNSWSHAPCDYICYDTYDRDMDCESWAKLGYCDHTYANWMTANCQKACNKCDGQRALN